MQAMGKHTSNERDATALVYPITTSSQQQDRAGNGRYRISAEQRCLNITACSCLITSAIYVRINNADMGLQHFASTHRFPALRSKRWTPVKLADPAQSFLRAEPSPAISIS